MTTNKLLLQLKSFLFEYFDRDNNLIAVFSSHNNFTGNCKYGLGEKSLYQSSNCIKQSVLYRIDILLELLGVK